MVYFLYMEQPKRKTFLDFLSRGSKPLKEIEGEVKQKKSGGYNTKRVRIGRSGDTSGKRG